jgi:hypothetical protein
MPLEEQEEQLHEWTKERADDPVYFYGRQTGSKIDPRSQNEDLGDNSMKASTYGIANLQVITDNLIEWTSQYGEDFSELDELYGQIIGQWSRYMGHVTQNVGGVYENDKTFDQEGPVYEPTPKEIQKEAMDFLRTHAFSDPSWILNQDILNRVNQADFVDNFRGRQVSVLNNLIDPQRIARLIEYDNRLDEDVYSPYEFMDDVRGTIWTELDRNSEISVYRRNLQRAYIERMEYLMTEELPNVPAAFRQFLGFTSINVSQSDIRPMVREQLEILQRDINNTVNRVSDRATKLHLADAERRIDNILNPN